MAEVWAVRLRGSRFVAVVCGALETDFEAFCCVSEYMHYL